MKATRNFIWASVALALALASTSCNTLHFRDVQSDFQRAVEAETARAESPFVDWYQGVAVTLSDDFIGDLDEKLRPNAWMLRGVSEWRSGNYTNAYTSASRGTKEIDRQKGSAPNLVSSRDAIVLTMLPGLVQDSQLRNKLQTLGTNKLMVTEYESKFLPEFKAVVRQFGAAKDAFGAPTPSGVKYYWNYQVWRVLQNWSFALGRLPTGREGTTNAYGKADEFIADNSSRLTGGTNMVTAMKAAKEAIPADYPYRRLIEFEEKE